MIDLPRIMERPDGVIVSEGNSDASLVDLLKIYEEEIAQAGAPVHLLQPGISRDEVQAAFAQIDAIAPEEVVAWHEWHNGSIMDLSLGMSSRCVNFVDPIPVAEVIARHLAVKGHGQSWAWSRKWIQLGPSPYSLAVGLDQGADDAVPVVYPSEGIVLGRASSAGAPMLSLSTVVTISLEAIRRGALRWTKAGWRTNKDIEYYWGSLTGLS